jgi:hypothetical protein
MAMVDDESAPPSAAESLRLIDAQREAAVRSLSPDPRLIYWPWGLAWFVGFGLLFLRHGPHERVYVDMPSWLPLVTLYVLMVVAFVVSGVSGARANRQISGDSSIRGRRYGLSWGLGFLGTTVICIHFSDRLPPEEVTLLWSSASVALVGVLYLAGSAIWHSTDLLVLGVWLTISNIVGVAAGAGWHALVTSLAGGGGLLVAGFVLWLSCRRRA